jgi:hypothetical protein
MSNCTAHVAFANRAELQTWYIAAAVANKLHSSASVQASTLFITPILNPKLLFRPKLSHTRIACNQLLSA